MPATFVPPPVEGSLVAVVVVVVVVAAAVSEVFDVEAVGVADAAALDLDVVGSSATFFTDRVKPVL
jgi:hypothetical protein